MATTVRGPLFNGRAAVAVRAFCSAAEEDIAEEGLRLVRSELSDVLQHPTGRYQSRLHVEQRSGDSIVTDGGVVYGPWLEGTGSRNRTTRFKGYMTFRRMRQRLQGRAAPIAERTLPRFLRRMG